MKQIVVACLVLCVACVPAVIGQLTADSVPPGLPTLLSRILPQLLGINIQHMANLAMNPVIDNQTLVQLYQEASEVINATGGDTVLLSIDPKTEQKSANNSLLVLAVTNPNVPTHEDLLRRFRLYFVNVTEVDNRTMQAIDHSKEANHNHTFTRPSLWQILVNLARNQAHALAGALSIPFSVSANAIKQSSQLHAEYVNSGSSFGVSVSSPIILQSLRIPEQISGRLVDLTTYHADMVDSTGHQGVQLTDQAISTIANGLGNGTNIVSNATNRYVLRPLGAFTGFNLNLAGQAISSLGQSITSTGLRFELLGQQLNSGAIKAVSSGATAIAWGLDNTVSIPAASLTSGQGKRDNTNNGH